MTRSTIKGPQNGAITFNEGSADVDFRVESDGQANMLFVDGGNNRVNVGHNASVAGKFNISEAGAQGLEVVLTDADDVDLLFYNRATSAYVKANYNAEQHIFSGHGNQTSNNSLVIDSTGAMTNAAQPSFYVDKTDSQQTIPINSDTTINFNTERYDTATAFASDTFTAPVTGKYYLNVGLLLGNPPTDASYMECAIVTSNRRIGLLCDYDAFDQTTVYWAQNFSCVVDMDASDTAAVRIYQAGGVQNAFVYHNSASTYFCGILIG